MPLSTQVYELVPANLILVGNLGNPHVVYDHLNESY